MALRSLYEPSLDQKRIQYRSHISVEETDDRNVFFLFKRRLTTIETASHQNITIIKLQAVSQAGSIDVEG